MRIQNLLSSIFLFSLINAAPLDAQESLPRIPRFSEEQVNIQLDGFVDEPVWQELPYIDGMKVIEPDTLEEAPY